MASSTHHLPNPYGTTAAPPPTPSTQPNPLPSSAAAADVLSRMLHRLPPTLSLPTRLSPPPTTTTTTTSPPLIFLSPQNPTLLTDVLSASSQFGFFHLTNHSISPQLARSAESDSLSLFTLSNDQKQIHFPKNWPLGFDCDDNEDDDETRSDSFCFDSACSPESTELSLSSLREFTREMEKVGLEVVEALSCAVGFVNPVREDPTRVRSLMWISEGSPGNTPARFYPYVVGLEYQIRCRKYSLLADSGWISDSPRVDSIVVTLGDIAQVWTNGKIKKVRGRPVPSFEDNNNNAHCISMSLLVTLPLESIVSPLLPKLTVNNGEEDNQLNKEDNNDNGDTSPDTKEDGAFKFNSFSFEDYAWRIYHERLLLKDPLARYRI